MTDFDKITVKQGGVYEIIMNCPETENRLTNVSMQEIISTTIKISVNSDFVIWPRIGFPAVEEGSPSSLARNSVRSGPSIYA